MNGKFVGKPFDSREGADQITEPKKLADPSALVRVKSYPILRGEIDPDEREAIVEGEDFSDLPPEHRGPMDPSDEGQGEAASDAALEYDNPSQGEKTTKNGKSKAVMEIATAFFIRYPSVPIRGEDLEELWAQDKIAVYLPDIGDDSEGLNPSNRRKFWEKVTLMQFEGLAKKGGYVWADTRAKPGFAKVGRVSPQEPENFRTVLAASKNPKYAGKTGIEVVLRTVRLEDVKEVAPKEAVNLRAERPMGGTIWPWANYGSRLKALIEGSPVEHTWSNLTPRHQRAVCVEFLRHHDNPHYPRLKKFLLYTYTTMDKDVDVYGVAEDGTEILVQITTSRRKGSSWAKWKVEKLKKFDRPGNKLVCFCRISDGVNTPSLFPPGPAQEDGVLFISVEQVLRWVEDQPEYAEALFSS